MISWRKLGLLPSAALNDLEPGTLGRGEGSISRKNSICSHASGRSRRWSSGKALPPPPPLSARTKEFFASRWRDRRKRRQWSMWIGFALVLLFTAILAIALVARFTSSFGEPFSRTPVKEKEMLSTTKTEAPSTSRNEDKSIKQEAVPASKGGGELILLVGGRIGSGFGGPRASEVLSYQGSCNLPEGYPAPLPEVRVGNVVGAVGQMIISCGGVGITSIADQAAHKTCWAFSPTTNTWTSLRDSLPVAVSYAAGVVLGQEFWVIGGNDNDGLKTSYIQIFNTATMRWRLNKTPFPYEVWGHCAVKIKWTTAVLVTGGWSMNPDSLSSAQYMVPSDPRGSADQWLRLPPMNEGRATHGCAAVKYKGWHTAIVVAGGMGGHNGPISSVEILPLSKTLTTDGWIRLPEMHKRRSWYPAVAVLSKRLIVAAGQNLYGQGEDSIEEYNPETEAWKQGPIL